MVKNMIVLISIFILMSPVQVFGQGLSDEAEMARRAAEKLLSGQSSAMSSDEMNLALRWLTPKYTEASEVPISMMPNYITDTRSTRSCVTKNEYGWELFSYSSDIIWSYESNNNLITNVSSNRYGQVVYAGWRFVGHQGDPILTGGIGKPDFTQWTQGHFELTTGPVVVMSRYPIIEHTVRGTGSADHRCI